MITTFNLFIHRIILMTYFMLGIAVIALAQHENKTIRNGNQLYQDKKFTQAEMKYKEAIKKNKDSKEAGFNLGDALYEQKKYEEATEQFNATAKTAKDKKLQAQAYHNLGNSYLQNKKYEESINAYKNALKMNPEDDDTRYNLAYAKSKLIQQHNNKIKIRTIRKIIKTKTKTKTSRTKRIKIKKIKRKRIRKISRKTKRTKRKNRMSKIKRMRNKILK
jgi:Ca-activated chloride channel family protein